jgi:hypothetical protein
MGGVFVRALENADSMTMNIFHHLHPANPPTQEPPTALDRAA